MFGEGPVGSAAGVWGALLAWLVMALACASAAADASTRTNVVFILADDLGYSDTTLHGTTRLYETPNLERLAERGILFSNAYASSPMCSATRASILTGLYRRRHGFTFHTAPLRKSLTRKTYPALLNQARLDRCRWGRILTGQAPARHGLTGAGGHLARVTERARYRTPAERASRPRLRFKRALIPLPATRMPAQVETLATALGRAGYVTGHFGKWHLGAEPHSPLQHGFAVDVPHTAAAAPGRSYRAPWGIEDAPAFRAAARGEHLEARMAREAIAFMEANRERAFFLNYWAFSVHAPFDADPAIVAAYRRKIDRLDLAGDATYAAMVEHFDRAVGALLDTIDRLGLSERTIVIFSSDNGGSTYDRHAGRVVTSNAPLRGGKAMIYEGGIRVPALVSWPGQIPANTRSDALLDSSDWFPTLLDLLEIEPQVDQVFDGVSQRAALWGGPGARDRVFCYLPHYFPLPGTVPATSLRQERWKLIRFHHDAPGQRNRYELYDLAADPGERRNLANAQPERVRQLDASIGRYLEQAGALVPVRNPDYRPEPGSAGRDPS